MQQPEPQKRFANWRNTLRNLHRDFGFFAVGLTFIYAISGLAVNHINDWDPSYSHYQRLLTVDSPLPEDEGAAVAEVLKKIESDETPADVFTFRDTIIRYEILLKDRRVEIHPDRREILVTRQGSDETEVYPLGDPLPDSDWEAATTALGRIGIGEEPLKVHRVTIPIRDITITLDNRDLNVQDFGDGYDIIDKGQSPRFFLHAANWLHVNRGKGAWTYIADAYAIVLLFLATSGMLMVRGRKGVVGRGGVFLLIGIAVPVLYLIFAGP